jgi:hypothetical protein
MKKIVLAAWQQEYKRLQKQLIHIGYISQGSVVDRSRLKKPRSGFQWTHKLSQKTVTVALSQEQFKALSQAIHNRRILSKTIRQMEQLSRKILFATASDTTRRKPLRPKALGTN